MTYYIVLSFIVVFVICIYSSHQQCFYTSKCYTAADNGMTYRGTVNMTEHGQPCIKWSVHPFDVNPTKYPASGLDSNFCRNVHGSGHRPWCYTNTNRNMSYFGYCNVPKCELCLFRGIRFKEGDVFHNGCSQCVCTALGIRCFTCKDYYMQNHQRNISTYLPCYKVADINGRFPKCCSHTVCHGDAEFDIDQYTYYIKQKWLQKQGQRL